MESDLRGLAAYEDASRPGGVECVCNVGVQACPMHPGNLKSTIERILFEKSWDLDFRKNQP